MADNISSLKISIDSSDAKKASNELNNLTGVSGKAEKGIDALTAKTSILNAKNAILAFATGQVAKTIVSLSDNLTNANNKLTLVSKSVADLTKAQEELYKVAQRTNQGYSETVDLYSNLATSMQDMGKSQAQIIRTVETVNKAISISGANAQQASAAILQLGQAFGSGELKGDELNSLKENAQGLVKAIAQGMGVSTGQLKQLGSEGKITSEVLAKALEKAADSVDTKFNNMNKSLGQGFTNVTNSLSTMAGEFLNATGASSKFADLLIDIAKNLDENKGDIVLYGQTTGAVIGKVVDNFMLLAADIKNVTELLLDSVGIMAFGALEPVTKLLLEATKSLNDLGLSSNETLSNAQGFYNFANKGLTNFKASAETNLQDIDNAYKKANVSVADRIALMQQEWESSKKTKFENAEKTTIQKKAIELTKEQIKSQQELNKAYSEMSKVGMTDYELSLSEIADKTKSWLEAGVKQNDVLVVQNKLLEELNLQNSLSIASEQLSFLEKKAQLMTDEYEKAKLLLEISYAKNLVDIQGRNIPLEDKQKLIEQENELYNLTKERIELDRNTEYQETMSNFYDDMIESQINLNEAVYNFGSGFDDVGSKISKVSKSLAAMTNLELTNKKEVNKLDKKYEKEFIKYAGDVQKTKELEQQYTKDTALLNEANVINQINGYANIAGAMSGMFQEGSKEAAAFRMVESGLAIASGVRAILTQGSGDPYTAFARMAAMTASVSSLLSSAGIAFGMNKTTTSSDAFSSQKANEGKGSILGDSKKASESITNALNTLEDFAQPQYDTLLSMNDYLANISNNIGGVTKLLIQNAGYALGEGYTGFDSGMKNNLSIGNNGISLLSPINALVSEIPVIGQINSMLGGAVNSVVGGLFGKSSVSQALTDSGITFADQLLTSAIKEFNGLSYQTISTTVKNKSWFGSSESTSIDSYFQDLDAETERQFTLVLDGLYQTVLTAGLALDRSKEETTKSLEGFKVSLGKISLKDKSGQEIQELLTNAFSEVGDEIAKAAFPLLESFQQVGEGLFETLTRVATGMEEAEFYIDRLGNKFQDVTYTAIGNKSGNVGFEALLQSITKFDESTYGLNNNLISVVKSVEATASELYTLYTTLSDLRDIASYLSFDIDTISQDAIRGAGSINDLSQGMKDYVDNFLTDNQKLGLEITKMRKEFSDLGLTMPKTKQAFTDMLKDASENNEELYGRLIVLSEGLGSIFDEVENVMNDKISLINDTLNNLDSTISGLRSSVNGIDSYALDRFYQSMAKTQDLLSSGDYEAIAKSINETIGLSSALSDTNNFKLSKDMQFAQLVAAKQFEDMKDTLKDDVDYLSSIDTNTANTNTAINNLSEVMKAFLTGGTMPSFAVGTSYVSNDMTARIHKGEIITPKNFSDGLRNGDLVMGQTSNMITAINNMGALLSQNVANLENKLNSIISLSNGQLNQLKDIRDINNESLVTLGNIEVII